MKKRLIVFANGVVLLCCVILGTAWVIDGLSSPYFSAPDEVREHALSQFDEYFVDAPRPIPDLKSAPAVPSFQMDDSKKGLVTVRWSDSTKRAGVESFGDRITANPATQSFSLPNGQEVRLVGVAYSPKPQQLPELNSTSRWRRREKITWYDPASMKPITDPESVGLERKMYVDFDHELLLAFHCKDLEARPVRWHGLRLSDERTKASVSTSSHRITNTNGIVVYKHRLSIFHSTPVRILLPISYGEVEEQEFDLKTPNQTVQFGGDAMEFTVLLSRDGEQNSRGLSSYGASNEADFFYKDSELDSRREKSFSLISVWPPVQGNTLQYFEESNNSWRVFYAQGGIVSVTHKHTMPEMMPQKWRRFPQLARGIFELKGIPDLPDLDNLFTAEVGPLRFKYNSEFRDAITGPILFEWNFREKSIPNSEFPIEFADPSITPEQLLAEYQKRIGMQIVIDDTNHELTEEKDPWLVRLKQWWQRTTRRLFP